MARRSPPITSQAGLSSRERELMVEIDDILPHYVWERLRPKIDQMPWEEAKSACESGLPSHREDASQLFQQLMTEMENYIKAENKYLNRRKNKLHDASAANCRQMDLEMTKIKVKYGDDPVGFVFAVARLQQLASSLDDLRSIGSVDSSPGLGNLQIVDPVTGGTEPTDGLATQDLSQWSNLSPLSTDEISFPDEMTMELSQKFEDLGSMNSEIFSLENLLQHTRDHIEMFDNCVRKIKELAANVFPKGNPPVPT
ncbi:hypothetical protein EGW08_005067, partial [Elysia chlorotica]